MYDREDLTALRQKQRGNRTRAEQTELDHIPGRIDLLKNKIDNVFGFEEKQTTFKAKYTTFYCLVTSLNTEFPSPTPIACHSFEILRGLKVYDPFWDLGQLTHPGEAWAVDQNTQEGIQAYLNMTHARDQLARLSRECRQMMRWALKIDENISVFQTAVALEDPNVNNIANKWMMEVVGSVKSRPSARLAESKEVLLALVAHLSLRYSRLWINWNLGMGTVVQSTVGCGREAWQRVAQAQILEAAPLDEDQAEDDKDDKLPDPDQEEDANVFNFEGYDSGHDSLDRE
ncbi:hypothetical protein DFH28DRAFT_1077634 [Melampsora americana]|nr:hypothetical protein DFH28DRAFT_1077634 [Melampsora americana]